MDQKSINDDIYNAFKAFFYTFNIKKQNQIIYQNRL